jgi:hypothetical protein
MTSSHAPPPLLARFSLDYTLLALQTSPTTLHIHVVGGSRSDPWVLDIGSDNTAAVSHSVLAGGVIWSDHGGNSQDLCIVSTRGIDMYVHVRAQRGGCERITSKEEAGSRGGCASPRYKRPPQTNTPFVLAARSARSARRRYKVSPTRNQLAAVRSYKYRTLAFHYEPQSRALVIAGGLQGDELRTFFLTKSLSDSVKPRLELPPPKRLQKFTVAKQQKEAHVRASDFALVSLYGRPYCCDIQPDQSKLDLYLLDPSNLSSPPPLVRSFRLYTPGPTTVSVVDSVLLVHSAETTLSFLYDLKAAHAANEDPICGGSTVILEGAGEGGEEVGDGGGAGGEGGGGGGGDADGDDAEFLGDSSRHCKALYDGTWSLLSPHFLLCPHCAFPTLPTQFTPNH